MQFVQDHVIHFYHLHALDWVDVVSALKADPADTAADRRSPSRPGPTTPSTYFAEVQNRLKTFVGQRAARHLRERLLGPPGVQAAAGGEPARAWRTTSRRSTGSATSSGCTRSSAARTPIRTSWWAAWRRRSTSTARATINAARLAEHPGHDRAGAGASWSRCTGPTSLAIAGFYKEWAAIGGGRRQLPRRAASSPRRHRGHSTRCYFPRGMILDKDLIEGPTRTTTKRCRSTSTARGTSTPSGDDGRAAPVRGRDEAEVHRPADAVDVPAGREEVHVDEGAAVRRAPDARSGRSRGCWSRYASGHKDMQEMVEARCWTGSRSGRRRSSRRSAAPRPAAWRRCCSRGRWSTWYDKLVEPHQERRHRTFNARQVGSGDLAGQGPGLRLPRRAARRARALGADREREDLPLPVRGAEHVELLAARRQGAAGPVRGGADGQPSAGQSRAAARDPAHDPLVRSLHGVRRARARRRRATRSRRSRSNDATPSDRTARAGAGARRARSGAASRRPAATTAGCTSGSWPIRAMHWIAAALRSWCSS